MNKIKQRIGYHYPCIIHRKRRGEYLVYFEEISHVKPGGFIDTHIKLAFKPLCYARVYRDLARPKTWFMVISRHGAYMVDSKSGFKTMIEAAEYAREKMMDWAGWHDNQA